MDRRGFLAGLGLCSVFAVPFGCSPKKSDETETDGPPEGEKMPPMEPSQDKAEDADE